MKKILENLIGVKSKIISITLYKYNVEAIRKFSFGTWTSRQHVIISIETDNNIGYGENIITTNEPNVSLLEWESWSFELIGKSVSDADRKSVV